ncbi:MAG: universal stress protein [Saprospiraceae bacterium]|nr:universal stress protein [Saprospiraceae bacterium]
MRILFPTDFSAQAQSAYQYALQAAAHLNCKIDLVNVYYSELLEGSMLMLVYLEETKRAVLEKFEKEINAFAGADAEGIVERKTLHYSDTVASGIVSVAADYHSDLIVMSMKGRHTVMEQLLGSITTDTIALSPVPVLVIPEGSQYRPVRKIAYATNFEAGEAVAFAKLKAWKERFGAEVEIVHVTAGRPVDRERRKAAEGFLSTEFGEVVVIDHPSVADGLEAYLQGSKADLLAFFKPQRSFWKNLLHASESKDILRKANLPVLVVVGA